MDNSSGRMHRLVRSLFRTPFFTFITILTLGVGIGANAAIFSVVYSVLLKPLPFDHSESLVGVWHTATGPGIPPKVNQGPATYFTYREEGRSFEDIGLWDEGSVSVTGRGDPERLQALLVTDATLPLLRVQPVAGRRFTRRDDSPGSESTVMLTYGYWQRKFGGNAAIGQHLVVDGVPREIIGVLPASFKFLQTKPEMLLPFRFDRSQIFVGNFSYQGIARLKPGVTVKQANADVARMIPLIMEKFPLPKGFTRKMFEDVHFGPDVHPLAEDVIGEVGRLLWVVFGTVGIVLLIACANVANLFLVRAEGRQQELAVRSALGATRARMARELLGESLTLSIAAGAFGALLAYAGIRVLIAVAPEGVPRLEEIAIDPLVLLFTLVISLAVGVVFGLIPVFRFAPSRLSNALKEGGRASSDGRERHRARNALVVTEVALALVLLVGSGLMIRTFHAMRSVQPGFVRPEEVLTARISIPQRVVPDAQNVVRTFEQMADRIRQIPGVTRVGVTSSVTMDGFDSNDPVFVEDFPIAAGSMPPIRRFKWVGADYSETMGNRLVAGRTLTWEDSYKLRPVVVVTENFARQYWKNPAAALGRRIRTSPTDGWTEIVGVIGNELDDGVAKQPTPIVYWPMLLRNYFGDGQFVRRSASFAIRSGRSGSPTLVQEVQKAIWSVNRDIPLSNVRTLTEIRAESMAQTSFALVMIAIAGAVALLLGIVGIYAVIAYMAAQRTREVGIRVALGAEQRTVSAMFVRHGLMLTSIGLAIGLGAAAALTRLMSTLLFGVPALDPLTYAAVSAGLLAVAVLASYFPARRAARVDPVVALRAEA